MVLSGTLKMTRGKMLSHCNASFKRNTEYCKREIKWYSFAALILKWNLENYKGKNKCYPIAIQVLNVTLKIVKWKINGILLQHTHFEFEHR